MGPREWWNSLKQAGAEKPKLEVTLRAEIYFQQEDPKITEARKAATAYAQMGDYVAAVAELERVRDLMARDGSPADCASEIRLAKYLQKAGRGDEAWQLFIALFEREKSHPWSLIDLLDAMRLHLQREGRAREAIRYGVAMRLAQVKLYRDWRLEAEAALARPVQGYGDKELERLTRENQKRDIEICERWLAATLLLHSCRQRPNGFQQTKAGPPAAAHLAPSSEYEPASPSPLAGSRRDPHQSRWLAARSRHAR